MNRRTRRTAWCLIAALSLSLGLGPRAWAQGVEAHVVGKDAARGTLSLDDGRTLRVTARTRIQTEQGDPVPFSAVPTAPQDRGRFALTGNERIEYEATERDGDWFATRIVLRPITAR